MNCDPVEDSGGTGDEENHQNSTTKNMVQSDDTIDKRKSVAVKFFAIGSTTYGDMEGAISANSPAATENEQNETELKKDDCVGTTSMDSEQTIAANEDDDNEDDDKKKPSWGQLREVLWVFGKRRIDQQQRRKSTTVSGNTGDESNGSDSAQAVQTQESSVGQENSNIDTSHGEFATHPDVLKQIDALWNIEDLREARTTNSTNNQDVLTHDPYIRLLVKFQYLIVPRPFSHAKAKINAEIDWQNDSQGLDFVDYKCFRQAMYELAETWSHTHTHEAYAGTLERLLIGVTSKPDTKSSKRNFKANNNISIDLWFQDAAKEIHNQHTERKRKERKRGKKHKDLKSFNLAQTISLIAKIYHAKFDEDRLAAQHGRNLGGFDSFVKKFFTIQYGSTDLADKNHGRLVKSVLKWYKTHPRVRLFARLADIEIVPLSHESLDDTYDPKLCSNFFLPLVHRLLGDSKMEVVLGANAGEPIHVLMVTFQLGLAAVCRHVPTNSLVAMRTKRQIVRNRLVLQASQLQELQQQKATGNVESGTQEEEGHGSQDAKGTEKNTAFNRRPTAFLLETVSKAMEQGSIPITMKNQSVIDFDDAMLAAFELWKVERQWHSVSRLVASAKAAVQWRQKTCASLGKEYQASSILHILSNTLVVDRAINVGELHSVANFIATSKIVEELTGIGIDDALPFGTNSDVGDPLLLWEAEFNKEMSRAKAEHAKKLAARAQPKVEQKVTQQTQVNETSTVLVSATPSNKNPDVTVVPSIDMSTGNAAPNCTNHQTPRKHYPESHTSHTVLTKTATPRKVLDQAVSLDLMINGEKSGGD